MNSIIDLNTAANITFNNQSAYAIAFGNSLGNITANIDNFTTNGVTKQVSITTLTDPVRDVLVDWQFSNVGVVTMAYAGPYANISLNQIAPATWRAYGIRSINQYDEAMANVKYTDITGGLAPNPDYNYLTVINDQEGNTRNWLTTLNVIANPTISITGNVQYAEDTLANVTIANIVVDPASTAVFRLFANVSAANGEVSNGVVTANSVSIDGTANSLNSQLAAAAIKFLPASDLTSNVANAINFNLVRSGNSVNTANANITCVATHNEYLWPTTGTYYKNQPVYFGNTISDLDTHAISYTVTFNQASGNIGNFYVNGINQGYSNTNLTFTNTKSNINNSVSWRPQWNDLGNVVINYSQIKTLPTGNVTQASNVSQTLSGLNAGPNIELICMANAKASNAQVKFGAGALSLHPDGSGGSFLINNYVIAADRLNGDTSNVFVFGNAQPWTMEAWVYTQANNSVTSQPIFNFGGNVSGSNIALLSLGGSRTPIWQVYGSNTLLPYSTTATITSITPNAWSHLAMTYDGSDTKIYLDGNSIGSSTKAGGYTVPGTGNIFIGGLPAALSSARFIGYLDDIRISSNVRYTGNFTVPGAAFTTDANTVLLIHADEIGNGGGNINNDRYVQS